MKGHASMHAPACCLLLRTVTSPWAALSSSRIAPSQCCLLIPTPLLTRLLTPLLSSLFSSPFSPPLSSRWSPLAPLASSPTQARRGWVSPLRAEAAITAERSGGCRTALRCRWRRWRKAGGLVGPHKPRPGHPRHCEIPSGPAAGAVSQSRRCRSQKLPTQPQEEKHKLTFCSAIPFQMLARLPAFA